MEIVVDQLPEETEREAAGLGALVSRDGPGVRVVADSGRKREIEELLRRAGSDIVSLRMMRSSLEDLFLKLVEAAWASAEAVAGEMRSGTILAVLARPVRRWEFPQGST